MAVDLAALRHEPGVVQLDGLHALKHALRFGAEVLVAQAPDPAVVDALAAELAPDVRDALTALVQPGPAAHPTGVVALARRPVADPAAVLADRTGPVVVLEDPRRLGNVGAAIRVAAAAGAAGVLTTGRADPWDPAALRGAAGLHFALPVARVDAIDPGDRPLVALDPGGEPLTPGALPTGALLAFGTERAGLSAALLARADTRVRIPMRPGVSSLNLATAVAVVLYAAQPARADAGGR